VITPQADVVHLDVDPPFVLVEPVDDERADDEAGGEDSRLGAAGGRLVMSPSSRQQEELFAFLLTLPRGFLDERRGGVALRGRAGRR
jgi:hypothetical protein